MTISEQIALAAIFYFLSSFCFLQFNQQKPVGMVSTNNVKRTFSEQMHNPS